MAYSSADDAFKIREPKKGDQVLQAFLNSDTEVTHVTSAVGLPVAVVSGGPSGYTLEATQLSVLAAVDGLESAVDGLEALLGRWTPFRDSSVDNTAQTMKASPGSLGHAVAFNKNAEDCWLHFYDAANVSGTPTYSLLVPKGDGTARGAAEVCFGQGLTFDTAIRYNAVTTASAANPGIALELNAGYV